MYSFFINFYQSFKLAYVYLPCLYCCGKRAQICFPLSVIFINKILALENDLSTILSLKIDLSTILSLHKCSSFLLCSSTLLSFLFFYEIKEEQIFFKNSTMYFSLISSLYLIKVSQYDCRVQYGF
uniref:Uncharacterized protein n=1 Tax=Cacopsylla melanoneura TaxID=428564 RepID=A0A8D8U4H8_9HEMI